MPLPTPTPKETREEFLNRCMADPKMVDEYPEAGQRYAVCSVQYATNKDTQQDHGDKEQGREA